MTTNSEASMTKEQFKAWCAKHELSIEKAGVVLGFNRATAFRYANGGLAISTVVAYSMEEIDLLPADTRVQLIERRLSEWLSNKA